MSKQGKSRVLGLGLLLSLGILVSGCFFYYQHSRGKIDITSVFFNRAQTPVFRPENNTQRQDNASSLGLNKGIHYKVYPRYNTTQNHNVSQFVSFSNSIHDGRRLGNQLFDFAAVVFVAELTGRRPVLLKSNRRLSLESVFQLNLERVDTLCPCHTIGEARHLSYDENTENEVLKAGNKSILVNGFRQSWKYTMGIEHRLRRYLVFQDAILRFAENFLRNNIPPGWKRAGFVRVGIHVRRGDSFKESFIRYGYTVANATYFTKAMNFFIVRYNRIQFIAMSDDRKWTVENIVIPKMSSTASVNVTHSFYHSAGQDIDGGSGRHFWDNYV